MRWDYPPLEINPVFPGLRDIIIIIIVIVIIILNRVIVPSISIWRSYI